MIRRKIAAVSSEQQATDYRDYFKKPQLFSPGIRRSPQSRAGNAWPSGPDGRT